MSTIVGPLTGLSEQEAARRLRRDGPNSPPPAPRRSLVALVASQLVHFFALLLWVAAVLAVVAGMPELGVAIVAVILVNAVFALLQELRADHAAERLRDLLPRRATVVRDARRRVIDAAELVVGDLVALEAGDKVSADLEVVRSAGLAVDASVLTGESEPVHPEVGEAVPAGAFVVEGEALARVTATGADTRLAAIAALTRAGAPPPTPLALALRRLVRTIAVIALSVGAVFFVVGALVGTPPAEGFIFAIGVTVALVPEALLPTVTLSLAVGAQRMARRHALVRHLESVETLGSTTIVCSDKTGTLTRNEMAVVAAWTPAGEAVVVGEGYEPEGRVEASPEVVALLRDAAVAAVRCSTGRAVAEEGRWVAQGDPMEAALDVLARRVVADVAGDVLRDREVRRFPFDPRRRRMSVVTETRVLVKGAPDALLPRCRPAPGADAALEDLTARGLRVLAVAVRDCPSPPATADEAERDLRLLALLGLEDPPRPGAAEAVAACRRAGVAVVMVTGDHPATALAIARETGLARGDAVLLGSELPDDEEELGRLVDRDGTVIARVAPEDKLRIAKALQRRGHVVAMTGDGVNDGPALQQADIGVAMGRCGTDVAREAADLVLLDDDFATIVAAIEQGRATFLNVRRFLTYHLASNVAEVTPFVVWALSGGRFPLALGVLQILALDLGTDTLSAVALGAEPPRRDVLQGPPVRGRLLDRLVLRRAFGVIGPTETVFAMGAFLATVWAAGWRPGEPFTGLPLLAASGAAFAAIAIGQTGNELACRSTTRWPGALGWLSNRFLIAAAVVELIASGVFLLVPPVARVLGHAAPTPAGWAVALAAGPAVLAVDAADKAVRRRRAARREQPRRLRRVALEQPREAA